MNLKKFFYKYILRKQYFRFGSCRRCGDCCSKIYVKHKSGVIKDEAEFRKFQRLHPFYRGLEIIDKDEQGLVFKCTNFDRERKICTVHFFRSGICRRYPDEEIFKFKGVMSENCGYYFKPVESFSEVLDKIKRKAE